MAECEAKCQVHMNMFQADEAVGSTLTFGVSFDKVESYQAEESSAALWNGGFSPPSANDNNLAAVLCSCFCRSAEIQTVTTLTHFQSLELLTKRRNGVRLI